MGMKIPKTWIDVTDDIPVDVTIGQTLGYEFEGSRIVLKITSKKGGRVWARHLDPEKFLKPEEADEKVTVIPK